MNHLAQGEFQSRTFFQGLNQSNSLAALAQNACGFFRAEVKTLALLAWADFLNAFGGGKFRFSSNKTSMALSAMMYPLLRKSLQQGVKTSEFYSSRISLARAGTKFKIAKWRSPQVQAEILDKPWRSRRFVANRNRELNSESNLDEWKKCREGLYQSSFSNWM